MPSQSIYSSKLKQNTIVRQSCFKCVMFMHELFYIYMSRAAGTMIASSSSVRVIARSNPSQVPPLLMHVGKVTGCNAGCQEVSGCSTRGGSQGIYITFTSAKK